MAIAFSSASHLFDDVEQLLNREYARNIAEELRPLVADGFSEERVKGAIHYMMVLNPMVEIYLLDRAREDPCATSSTRGADRAPRRGPRARPRLRAERGSHACPSARTPATAPERSRPFSAATPSHGDRRMGYVYIILGGERYDASLAHDPRQLLSARRARCVLPRPCGHA